MTRIFDNRTSALLSAFVLTIGPLASGALAANLVTDGSFESPSVAGSYNVGPITGWTILGSGGGVWDITTAPLGVWNVGAPDGQQVAWIAPAVAPPPVALGNPAAIEQTTGTIAAAGVTYTLTGYVGHPIGWGAGLGTTYTAAILANGMVVSSTTGTGPDGNFVPFSVSWTATGGELLGVRLSTNQAQTAFDAISLVPEPHEYALIAGLGLIGFAAQRRMRTR